METKSSLVSLSQRVSHPFKVLVAEDNPVNQQVITRLLKLENVTDLILAEDRDEAVNIPQKSLVANRGEHKEDEPLSLSLIDIQTPRMDGIKATKEYVG